MTNLKLKKDFSDESRKMYFNKHKRFVDRIKRSNDRLECKYEEITKLEKKLCHLKNEEWVKKTSDLVIKKSEVIKLGDYSKLDLETVLEKHWQLVNTIKSLDLNPINEQISTLEKEITLLLKKEWEKKTLGLNLTICNFMNELGLVVDKYHYDEFLDELKECFDEDWDDTECVYASGDLCNWYINGYNFLAGVDINNGVYDELVGAICDSFESNTYKKMCDAINQIRG